MEVTEELVSALNEFQINDGEETGGFEFMDGDNESVLMFIELFMSKNKERLTEDQVNLMDTVTSFIESKENEKTTLSPVDLFEIILLIDHFPEHADQLEALADFVKNLISFDEESDEEDVDTNTNKDISVSTTTSEKD